MFLDVTLKHVLLFDMVLKIVYMWVSHDIVVPIPISTNFLWKKA